jgi:hypothetical protein
MTNEEKRIKIAEALGWKPDDDGAGINTWEASYVGHKLYGAKPSFHLGKVVSYQVDCLVPDYFNDLNACHEMEKALASDHMRDRMSDMLLLVSNDEFPMWHASASERAEAFGLTLSLWKEGE